MSRAVVLTEKRVARAEEFRNEHEFWLGLGRITEWEDDDFPPDLTGDESEVEEVFVYIKSEIEVDEGVFQNYAHLVRDSGGDILYRDRRYRIVEDGEIYNEGAYYLLFQVTLPIDVAQSVDDYRQVGLFLDLQPGTGYEDEDILEPENVDDEGELYSLANFVPIVRVPDRFDRNLAVIEF